MPRRAAPIFLLFCIAMTGCRMGPPKVSTTVPPVVYESGLDRFPTGEELQPGDIILGRSYGTAGTIFANFGSRKGKYSHAALYYRDREGKGKIINIRPMGLDVSPPKDFFSRYSRLALVRCRKELDAKLICASADRWYETDRREPLKPDYNLDLKDHSELFCLELVSVIFTENGYPDPFAQTYRVSDFPAAEYVTRELKLGMKEIPSPNAVLDAPDFAVIGEWLRPDFDLREEALHDALVARLAEYFGDGWEVRTPPLGGRMKVRLLYTQFKLKRALARRKRFPTIPMAIGPRSLNVGYMLYQHIASAKDRARRQIYAGTKEEWQADRVATVTQEACDFFRERYYVRTGAIPAVPAAARAAPPVTPAATDAPVAPEVEAAPAAAAQPAPAPAQPAQDPTAESSTPAAAQPAQDPTAEPSAPAAAEEPSSPAALTPDGGTASTPPAPSAAP